MLGFYKLMPAPGRWRQGNYKFDVGLGCYSKTLSGKKKKLRSKCMIGEKEAGYWACSKLLCDGREGVENQRKVGKKRGVHMGSRHQMHRVL